MFLMRNRPSFITCHSSSQTTDVFIATTARQATASTPLIIQFYSYLCHGGKGCAMCVCRLHERTHSVWPQLWKDRGEYTNPLYKAEQSQSQGVLRPNTSPYCFK